MGENTVYRYVICEVPDHANMEAITMAVLAGRAITSIKTAGSRLQPYYPSFYLTELVMWYYYTGRYKEAVEMAKEHLDMAENRGDLELLYFGHAIFAMNCIRLKRDEDDRLAAAQVLHYFPEYSLVNGDPELFLSIHAEDVVKMPPGAPAAVGIQALETSIRKGLKADNIEKFSIKLDEVEAFGDLGFARGTYTFTATVRANGKTIEYDGKYLTVFKKQADGSWKIYRDCYSSNVSSK